MAVLTPFHPTHALPPLHADTSAGATGPSARSLAIFGRGVSVLSVVALAVVVLISTGPRSIPAAQGTTLAADTPRASATRLASPRRMAAAFAFPRAN
ncbi:hypothetical protein [Methylobacterium sp. V23]|uniref:hypothetical protein n=1 Tax=Methylobacterium sp. V23 TaxID=2044878 RepID=UPI000D4D8421|nr:hypothetical protein [Methylobacterium sp. V23]POR44165.1 hypothetical protein CRT23_03230 [Methylobacterium sp. V23]